MKQLTELELHNLREKISAEVHKLVNVMTKGLSEEQDSDLRQTMTEQFRFWRQ